MIKSMDWPQNLINESNNALVTGSIIKARKTLYKISKLSHKLRGKKLKLGIVRTFSIEAQIDFVKLALSILPCKIEIKVSDIDNIEQELLNRNSKLLKWKPDIILVLWRLEELIPSFRSNPNNLSFKKYKILVNELKKRLDAIIRIHTSHSSTPLIISTMPITKQINIYDTNNLISFRKIFEEINLFIFKLKEKYKNISIFDFNLWSAIKGKKSYDQKMDFFARQPISSSSIGLFASEIARSIRPLVFSSSKAIVVDADNVLWGGIIGEDGVNNLKIGNDFPGNIYKSIQEFILRLKSQGILLFLISKNNEKDVNNIFSEINTMPLKLSDFNEVKINWIKKFINLKEIAKNYNLGLDSFVFVDDQKFEREEMKYNLPQVRTLEISEDPIDILSSLENCWFFDQLVISKEDKIRSQDYKLNSKRNYLKDSIKNTEKFLISLKLNAEISQVNKINTSRVFQMLVKTNQFNLRTQRHTELQINKFMIDHSNILLTLSLSDKFGNQGIVGLIFGCKEGKDTIFVDSFLLSCRALGRGAEQALWYAFINTANKHKIKKIKAEYIVSKKNSQVSNLYNELGMSCIHKTKSKTAYELNLPYKYKKPNWINIVLS